MSVSVQDILTVITIVTLLSVVIGDRVLGWLRTRGVDISKVGDIYELAYNAHQNTSIILEKIDEGKLEKALEVLSKNVEIQTQLLREMCAQNKLNHEEHKLILDQLSRVNNR